MCNEFWVRPEDVHSPVIVSLHVGGLGDRLMTVPAMQALDTVFPGKLTVICDDIYNRDVYAGLNLRRVVEFRHGQEPKALEDLKKLTTLLAGCDVIIFFDTVDASANRELASMLQPCCTVSLWSWSKHVPLIHGETPNRVDRMFSLAQVFDPSLRLECYARPCFSPLFYDRAQQIRKMLPSEFRVLAVHADTTDMRVHPKMFCLPSLRASLDLFLDNNEDYVVFLLGWEDVGIRTIRNSDRVISCLQLPFPIQCCLAGIADAFVGFDSCYLHAADLFQVPGVGLFGPTDPRQWGFRFSPHKHLEATNGDLNPTEIFEALETIKQLAKSEICNASHASYK